ncbi:unnamed protein product [Didymodactylos carnosus]|uniref:EF-hand domain-containing protein n=1 Tax=Didymodactylos carnosus TaxID=1234261 RepID=A0A814IQE8_9BILA|nr:unnamed protein product [Didymodactylos carnosus]CAF1251638.1 unnamed protein product [Didymodactylos carnosus]CAF3798840.1 unnamed protein product [Didymodactylos carnosus]CAF4058853.1 unnamed protein product [Didymodactylos carnosus]
MNRSIASLTADSHLFQSTLKTSDLRNYDFFFRKLRRSQRTTRKNEKERHAHLLREQTEALEKAFILVDTNKDGEIMANEMARAVRTFGYNLSESEAYDIIASVDTDSSGTIDFNEFVKMVQTRLPTKHNDEALNLAFDLIDINQDGNIDVNELRQIMVKLGEKMTDDDVDEMIREADMDKNYLINRAEFSRIITMKESNMDLQETS